MSTSDVTQAPSSSIPAGRWRVDAAASQLRFMARGMFGLAPVKGSFSDFQGTLVADDNGAHGTLEIAATSLDTGNARRDKHLRSPDFFDVENHPTVTFSLTTVSPDAGGAQLSGVLKVGETELPLTAPLGVVLSAPDRLRLSTDVSVDRKAAGLGWSKLGMIQGSAQLSAELNLVPDQGSR